MIETNGVIDGDFAGSQIMQQAVEDLRRRNIDVAVTRLESERAHEAAARNGLIDVLGADHVFVSFDEAIQGYRIRLPNDAKQPWQSNLARPPWVLQKTRCKVRGHAPQMKSGGV